MNIHMLSLSTFTVDSGISIFIQYLVIISCQDILDLLISPETPLSFHRFIRSFVTNLKHLRITGQVSYRLALSYDFSYLIV